MAKILYLLFKESRPRQWIKNLVIFVSAFFTGQLFNPSVFTVSVTAFLAFCAASSSLYIFNDFQDLEKDRLHPFKKNRPLASGKLPVKIALVAASFMATFALYLSWQISSAFLLTVIVFYILQISYSLYLKHIILLDILTIAAGFILRVFAGEVATGYHIDIWLFLTVISASLFIAIGKRRSELTLLSGWSGSVASKTRTTLSHYSERMLDVYLSMFANSAWITYAFYTFLQRPPALRQKIISLFEWTDWTALSERKWLMITIPMVLYGIMRYLQLIYEKNEGESPEKVLLTDKPLMFITLILVSSLFTVIYILGH